MKKIVLIMLAVIASMLIIAPAAALAQDDGCTPSVVPAPYPDWNPGGGPDDECAQVECCSSEFHYKIEPWLEDGFISVHEYAGNTITITAVEWDDVGEALSFNWTSAWPVSCVIVKASTGANVYCYEGGSYGDNCLVTLTGAVSHTTFCFNENGGSSGGNGEHEVGGIVSPVNKAALLAPWIVLAVVALAGTILLIRRIRIQS